MSREASRPPRRLRRRWQVAAVGCTVAAGFVAAGCNSGSGSPGASIQGRSSKELLRSNASDKTVKLLLLGAQHGGFNFDGASNGAMTVTVPVGWRVDVTCFNESTELTHSCAIVQSDSNQVAFPGAAIPNLAAGLPPAREAAFSFTASKVGHYEIACLVPGHRADGMWDHFVVANGGKPSIVGAGPQPQT